MDAEAEFFSRLTTDLCAIRSHFQIVDSVAVESVLSNCSDPHNCGRTVHQIFFSNGRSILYKPRSDSGEQAWARAIDWVNVRTEGPTLYGQNILHRDSYHWADYVEDDRVRVRADPVLMRAAGKTLALAYFVGLNDIHYENLRVRLSQPVVVDLETMLTPLMASRDSWESFCLSSFDTPIRTGMLPFVERVYDDLYVDFSPFARKQTFGRSARSKQIEHLNSDAMGLAATVTEVDGDDDGGATQDSPAWDELESFVGGFVDAYQAIARERDSFQRAVLSGNRNAIGRFVFRPTAAYFHILRAAEVPRALMASARRIGEIDARVFECTFPNIAFPVEAAIAAAEVVELDRRDIPMLFYRVDGREIYTNSGKVLGTLFVQSGADAARSRLERASAQECEQFVDLIRNTVITQCVSRQENPWLSQQSLRRKEFSFAPDRSGEHEAVAIAERLRKCAMRSDHGGAMWFGHCIVGGPVGLGYGPIGYDFYRGVTGVGLFFSALYKITGSAKDLIAAKSCFSDLQKFGNTPGFARDIRFRMGGALGSGVAGIMYAMLTSGKLLEDYELVEMALSLAEPWSAPDFEPSTNFDLMGGVSGELLCLCSVASSFPSVLPAAIKLGEYLLETLLASLQERDEGSQWKPGLAHGISGVCLALARLHSICGDSRYMAGAKLGWEAEDRQIDSRTGFWEEPKERASSAFHTARNGVGSWCHGPVGIALSRLAAVQWKGGVEVPGLDSAVRVVGALDSASCPTDHLCCGTAAMVELSLTAEKGRYAKHMSGSRRLFFGRNRPIQCFESSVLPIDNPGFFRGLAGIGWTMLRTSHPDALPNACLIQ